MHRQRVKTTGDKYRWVQGKTIDELNDAIVRAYIESGRIAEFMDVANSKPTTPVNFYEMGEAWFSVYKSGLKETSKHDYRYQLDHLLYPTFSDTDMQSIKLSDVQGFLNAHPQTAKSTLRKSIIVLDQMFTMAIRDGLLSTNPVDKKMLKYPSDKVQERKALSLEDFEDVIANIPRLDRINDRRLLALLCFTGMRRGEIAGLKWEDIGNQVVHVVRNVTYPANDPVISTPKSRKGVRSIPLDSRLIKYLAPVEKAGFIFGGNAPLTRSAFIAMYSHIATVIDLHGASCHTFRHTYATALNNAGVDAKTIQSVLGHADISTTMNTYTHTNTENVLDAGLKFQKYTSVAQTI